MKLQRFSPTILSLPLILFWFTSTVNAIPILYDDFDDGVLDPAWTVTLENVTDWTYSESKTNLTVTDIPNTVMNQGDHGSCNINTINCIHY